MGDPTELHPTTIKHEIGNLAARIRRGRGDAEIARLAHNREYWGTRAQIRHAHEFETASAPIPVCSGTADVRGEMRVDASQARYQELARELVEQIFGDPDRCPQRRSGPADAPSLADWLLDASVGWSAFVELQPPPSHTGR